MDYLEELDRMADLVSGQTCDSEDVPIETKIELWQKLFLYSREEAMAKISERNNNLSRQGLSEDLWNDVKDEWIEKGYDKDAYEHMLERKLQASRNIKEPVITPTASNSSHGGYLLRLEGEASTTKQIQALLGSTRDIQLQRDEEDPSIQFCRVSLAERQIIESKLSSVATFISLGAPPSNKDLDPFSKYPTLGIDTTLPQHRPDSDSQYFEPKQDQYPLWYFFYGNLAKADILSPRLGIDGEDIKYVPAIVHNARMSTWKGKYRALLDGKLEEFIIGSAFLVTSKEVEDWLRAYETIVYEVVRCQIEFEDGSSVPGCVFRFCGVEN